MNKPLVIVTGGTIEALYSPEEGTPYVVPVPDRVEDSAIPEALERLHLREQCDVLLYSMQDSKAWSPESVKRMLDTIAERGATEVVIVSGTDAMPAVGRYLQALLASKPELNAHTKIILTGAMQSLRDKHGAWREAAQGADGWRNLSLAIDAARYDRSTRCVYRNGRGTERSCV